MPRVHCASCGAPSVLGASRCPKCLAPFGAAGPMSGMIPAEEEAPRARPNLRWLGAAIVGLVAMLGIGLWAALRGRGTPAPEPVAVASDSVRVAVAPPDSLAGDSTRSDPVGTDTAVTSVTRVATPQPVPSASAARAGSDSVYRATTWVWLRSGPANSSEQLGVVNPDQVVQILERRFAWVRVRVDGQEGWMSADYLERVPE
ncbi:MAG: Bacterial domain [Gemmatimonadota bacterium]